MKSTQANKSITPKKVAEAIAEGKKVCMKSIAVSVRKNTRTHFFAIIDGEEYNMTNRGFRMIEKSEAKMDSVYGFDHTTVSYTF